MSKAVVINEVGLRDGLQNQKKMVALDDKLKLLDALLAAGIRSFEVSSFVHPKAVPQMADAAELFQALPVVTNAHYRALVPNLKGYLRARDAGVRSIGVVVATSDTFNQRNINMDTATAMQVCHEVITQAQEDGCFVRAYIATACWCPFEGLVDVGVVHNLADEFLNWGIDELSIADTTGAGNPQQIINIVQPLVEKGLAEKINLHLHDTRGMALANTWAALELGIRNFDASIAGLGGCPFSPGASGNLATEDLVFLLHEAGFETNIDFEQLTQSVSVAETICAAELGGKIMPWWRNQKNKHKQ